MLNGDLNTRLEFEEHIKGMSDRQLMEFTARTVNVQGVTIKNLCHEVENKASKKLVTALLSAMGAFLLGVIVYVLKHIGFPQ